MSTEVALKSIDEVKALLRQHLNGIGVEIAKETEDGEFWAYWLNFGSFPVLIQHPPRASYCIVSFQITLPDEEAIAHLNEFYSNNDAKFMYELAKAFTSPLTAFNRVFDNGRVIGYTVSKLIYPYHPEFSMRNLDTALQAVVSVGFVGAAFLRYALKQHLLDHEVSEQMAMTQPGPMFG
jgi:hypothetical protein